MGMPSQHAPATATAKMMSWNSSSRVQHLRAMEALIREPRCITLKKSRRQKPVMATMLRRHSSTKRQPLKALETLIRKSSYIILTLTKAVVRLVQEDFVTTKLQIISRETEKTLVGGSGGT